MSALSDRRAQTADRLKKLREKLTDAEEVTKGKACVYATGSVGRGEASKHSDLDVFIVGKSNGGSESLLTRLDEILVKADLIKATRELGIQEFSSDGRWLVHYSVHEFTKTLGTPTDDATNTFTARLLLVLESAVLLEQKVHNEVLEKVIDAYWRDYIDHQNDFMPAFLGNDILRLWRTFCVNYEANTDRHPEERKARGKLKNYKLKHSRLLTCYSAVLYLLAVYRQKNTVSPSDALTMSGLSPTRRLEWLLSERDLADSHDAIQKLLTQYEHFLEVTDAPEDELVARLTNKETSRQYLEEAYQFGDSMLEALTNIGAGSRFYRLLVV